MKLTVFHENRFCGPEVEWRRSLRQLTPQRVSPHSQVFQVGLSLPEASALIALRLSRKRR